MQSQGQVIPGQTNALLRRYRALSRNPGNLDLIREQLAFMREQAEGDAAVPGAKGLTDQIGFLTLQAAHVAEGELDALAEILDDLLLEQAAQSDAIKCQMGDDEELRERLGQFRAALPSYQFPENPKELRTHLEEASELRDFAQELGESVNDLELHIFQVQTWLKVLTLAGEFQALFQAAKKAEDHTASAYLLQQCEATVRQILALEVTLSSGAKGTGPRLLADLKTESLSLRERTQKAESEDLWKAFNEEHRERLMWIEAVEPRTTEKTMKKLLEDINWAVKVLQQVLGRLTHPETIALAVAELEKLQPLHQKASDTQHNRYNQWALERIRLAYTHGLDHAGLIDDETKIGEALIEWLGPIDSRYLTTEVQRCYNEVFDYLYGRLNKPGDRKDFEKQGNKLYVLKKLMNDDKHELSAL